MSKVVLQVPVSKALKTSAEAVASKYGFSSLQEIIRVFMAKLAAQKIDISFKEAIPLSPRAEKRYGRMVQDINNGRNVTSTESLEELFSLLR